MALLYPITTEKAVGMIELENEPFCSLQMGTLAKAFTENQ